MKLRKSIGFYILSVYFVVLARSIVRMKFKPCKPCKHRNQSSDRKDLTFPERTVKTIIEPHRPDISAAESAVASEKKITTAVESREPDVSAAERPTVPENKVTVGIKERWPKGSAAKPPVVREKLVERINTPPKRTLSAAECLGGKLELTDFTKMNKKMIDAQFNFAIDSLKVALETTQNVIFSPHSIYEAIMLIYFGSRASTELSLKRALRIPADISKSDVQRFYSFSKRSIKQKKGKVNNSTSYKRANRLWISKEKRVRKCMVDLFSDELKKIDFRADPKAARNHINKWISDRTENQVIHLISNSVVSRDTDLVLANAVNFKGFWASRFNKADSSKRNFDGNKLVPLTFMHQTGIFNFVVSPELDASILELPYKGNEVSMFILLPQQRINGTHRVINRILETGRQKLRHFLNGGMHPTKLKVFLPRFKILRDFGLAPLFEALGTSELVAKRTELHGFFDTLNENLQLRNTIHRTKIEVNEKGTTAAAAPAVKFFASNPLTVFAAYYPFVFIIYDRINGVILVSGVFTMPEK